MTRLKNSAEKVALVTGGAQGIGRGIALVLTGQGWQVAVADVQRSSDFFYVRTDVAKEPAVRACVRAVVKRFGRLDALVNNAGLTGPDDGPVSKKDHAQHPAGRVGRDQDIAEMVAYLVSDAAGFITGQNFVIDGGMTRKMIYV